MPDDREMARIVASNRTLWQFREDSRKPTLRESTVLEKWKQSWLNARRSRNGTDRGKRLHVVTIQGGQQETNSRRKDNFEEMKWAYWRNGINFGLERGATAPSLERTGKRFWKLAKWYWLGARQLRNGMDLGKRLHVVTIQGGQRGNNRRKRKF